MILFCMFYGHCSNLFCLHAVPAPASVILSSSTSNPVRPIGSAVNLTCTVHVEFSPAVDVPVTVDVAWHRPREFVTNSVSQPVTGGVAIYSSTDMIGSFGRDQSGLHTCVTSLYSTRANDYIISRRRLDTIEVTTGEICGIKHH